MASAGLLLSTLVSMSIPATFGYIIDSIGKQQSHKSEKYVFLLSGIFCLGALGGFVRSYYFNLASERIIKNLRENLFSSMTRKSVRFFDRVQVGELVTRLNSDISIMGKSFAGENLAYGLRNATQLVSAISVMIYLSPKLTTMIGLILPVTYYSSRFYGKYVKKMSEQLQDELSNSSSIAEEVFTNIRTVKSFNREDREIEKYEKAIDVVYEISRRYAKLSALFFSLTTLFGNSTMLGIVFYGTRLCEAGEITVGTLTSFLFYTLYVGYSGVSIAKFFSDFMKGMGASKNVIKLMQSVSASGVKTNVVGPIADIKGNIVFRNVCFSYPNSNQAHNAVFQDLSMSMEAGKKYAIIGRSGVGKSTIISLLLKFYKPSKGQILVDGLNITDIPTDRLRSQMAVVSQNIELFSGSILDNIMYGVEKIEFNKNDKGIDQVPARVIEAAEKANAHDFIIKLPMGYHTLLKNKNFSLSGGEKQRISFARAVLKDPQIFLFDEVTSSLDPENEEWILKSINLITNKTVVIVTHSLNLIKKSDLVIHLKNKKVCAIGSPGEIYKHGDIYKELNE